MQIHELAMKIAMLKSQNTELRNQFDCEFYIAFLPFVIYLLSLKNNIIGNILSEK